MITDFNVNLMKKVLLLIAFHLPVSFLLGQNYADGVYSDELLLNPISRSRGALKLPAIAVFPSSGYNVNDLDIYFSFYSASKIAFPSPVQYDISADLVYVNPESKDTIPISLQVSSNQPQNTAVVKISLIPPALMDSVPVILRAVSIPSQVPLNVDPVSWNSFIAGLTLEVRYELGVKVNPAILAAPDNLSVSIKGKRATFSWKTGANLFPSYHVQVLRLFDSRTGTRTDEWQEIRVSSLDWTRALNLYTESSADSLEITVSEGTGFYVWRVRPIGNLFPEGIAHPGNYGKWSAVPFQSQLFKVNLQSPYFFFDDPDKDKNWIYSRTFSEGNQMSEKIVFADNLLNVKQEQTFLPSKDTLLVSQKVLDYSGRPTLSTIPVPVPNSDGLVYQKSFFRPQNDSKVYGPRNFDSNLKIFFPDKANTSNHFGYYSDENPDISIPDAQGYPFQRTIYYNEPQPRVKEQSGIGMTHMISNGQQNGMGRTTRVMYGTPAEDELVRIFGDEAPLASQVLKTVSTDPNNVSQIQYTNLSGKLLATAVSAPKNEESGLLPLRDGPANHFMVSDTLTDNYQNQDGLVYSKRVILQDTADLTLTYSFNCVTLQNLCTDVKFSCDYTLNIRLINIDIDSPGTIFEIPPIKLSNLCSNNNSNVFKVQKQLKNLAPGTYIITKTISIGSNSSVTEQFATERVENQIRPLTGLISGWLDNVNCAAQLDTFYQKLDTLSSDLKRLNNQDFKSKYPQVGASFVKEPEHSINIDRDNKGKPVKAIVTSACCSLDVPVLFIPPFNCPEVVAINDWNGNSKYEVNYNYFDSQEQSEFSVDFEGYAFSYLKANKCFGGDSAAIIKILYDGTRQVATNTIISPALLDGYEPGDFNMMVYHMLTDKYDCSGNLYDERPPEAKVCSTGTVTSAGTGNCDDLTGTGGNPLCCNPNTNDCTQYRCADLFACWKGLLDQIVMENCNGVAPVSPINASDKIDEYYGQKGTKDKVEGNTHNQHFEDNKKSDFWLDLAIALFNPWGKVRENQTDATGSGTSEDQIPKVHLAKKFLDCTGYRFSKIIADSNDRNSVIQNQPGLKPYAQRWGLNGKDGPKVVPGSSSLVFPFIEDPIFAFKYFSYPKGKYPELEFSFCFEDPNICLDRTGNEVPCCPDEPDSLCNFCGFGKIKCESTNKTWSCGQRFTFYKALEHYKPGNQPVAINSSTSPQPARDSAYYHKIQANNKMLIENILDTLSRNGKKVCEMRRDEFRKILLDTLEAKCYVIGLCRSDNPADDFIIPVSDLDAITEAIIDQCKKQAELNTYKILDEQYCRFVGAPKDIIGYDISLPGTAYKFSSVKVGAGGQPADSCKLVPNTNIYYCKATNLSYCDMQEYEQIRTWTMEIDLPSKCSTGGQRQQFTCSNNDQHTCVSTEKFFNPASSTYSPTGKTTGSNKVIISPPAHIEVKVNHK